MSSLDSHTGKEDDDEIQRIFDEIGKEKPMSDEEIKKNYGYLLDEIRNAAADLGKTEQYKRK
jgi:hypothetical protein